MRLAWVAMVAACGGSDNKPDAATVIDVTTPHDNIIDFDGPTPDGNPLTPDTLAGTGLCTDNACTNISSDVHAYTPRWTLWADTATKRRWIYLPPGEKIDTSDMNYWKFPVGTKLWKEFTRDGVRVETRYMVKLADESIAPPMTGWYYVSYQWNATEDGTTAVTAGVQNANGTQHDIPSRQQCKQCHENLKGTDGNRARVLGFGALQLDYDGDYDLEDLIAANLLTNPPTTGAAHTRFPLPGTATDTAAYGYLHANCGHCHNPTSSIYTNNQTHMVLRYDVGHLGSVADMPQFMTTVNHADDVPAYTSNGYAFTTVVIPKDPPHSTMIDRMNSTVQSMHMPQLGSEVVDPTGQTVLDAWINSLQ